MDALERAREDWPGIGAPFDAHYASLTRGEEAPAVFDRLRIDQFVMMDGDDRAALTALIGQIEGTAPVALPAHVIARPPRISIAGSHWCILGPAPLVSSHLIALLP